MRPHSLLAWVLAVLALEASAAGPLKKRVKKSSAALPAAAPRKLDLLGQVSSVTSEAAFLNRGSADGLVVGQTLNFTRNRKSVGSCTVDATTEHFSRCQSTGLRPGDLFPVSRMAGPQPVMAPSRATDSELARRATVLRQAKWELHDFDPSISGGLSAAPRVEVLLSHTTYFNAGSPAGPFGVQRLDAAVYDVELWRGLRASVDLTGLNFSPRPRVTRTVYQQSPVLLVRQLELGFRRPDVAFTASLGRTWLRAGTGLFVIDGAQAGWRLGDDGELGAYGGLLPDAARLSVAPSQWAAGAYGRIRLSSGSGPSMALAQLSARAGWSMRDVVGGRAEVGLSASLWMSQRFDANAGAELAFGKTQAPGGFDAAYVDVGWRPEQTLYVVGGARYRGLPTTGLTELGLVSPGQRALHGYLGFTWELASWLLVGAQGGLAADLVSGLLQAHIGPEFSFPRLLGSPLGLGLGYLEELGWLRGRQGYLQVNLIPQGIFRVLTRANWFQQQATDDSLGLAGHQMGASVALEVTVWHLQARLMVMGRIPLDKQGLPLGSASAQLGGSF